MARLYLPNEGPILRIHPDLATEIGLPESVLLLQLDFRLSAIYEYHDGIRWTRISTRAMHKSWFPFWSVATIDRTVQDMVTRELLVVADFNTIKYDKTRWFSLGPACATLQSVMLLDEGQAAPNRLPRAPKEPKAPKQDELGLYPMAEAISTVTFVPMDASQKGRIFKIAKTMLSIEGVTPGSVKALFGEGSVWYSKDWRGQKGSPPALSQVQSEYSRMLFLSRHNGGQAAPVVNNDGSLNL